MEEEKKEEITNKYSEYRNNEAKKSIEKDMTSTIVKVLFAVIFIAPVLFKLYSIKSDKNIKYKDKEEKE